MNNNYDAILVDDDIWTRERWADKFERCGKSIALYATPNSFIKSLKIHAKDIPIFIDYRFRNLHRNGSEIAAIALKKGFTKLFITTNLTKTEMILPDFISDVTSKEPPDWLISKSKSTAYLPLSVKQELIHAMNTEQKSLFQNRMSELYDAKFGSQCAMMGLLAQDSEASFSLWETAIYQSATDQEINEIRYGRL